MIKKLIKRNNVKLNRYRPKVKPFEGKTTYKCGVWTVVANDPYSEDMVLPKFININSPD